MSSIGGDAQVKGSTGWTKAPTGTETRLTTSKGSRLSNAVAGALSTNYESYGSGGSIGGGSIGAKNAEKRAIADQLAADMKGYQGMSIMDIPDPDYTPVVRLSLTPATDVGAILNKQEQQRAASEVTFGGSLTNLSADEKAKLIAIANTPSTKTKKEIEDSIPDAIFNQIKYMEKIGSSLPEDVGKKVYNTILTASVIGVEKFPAIREVLPNIDTVAKMISDSPEQLKTMSIQQISDAITTHITDSKIMGTMVPEFIKTLQEGTDYKLHIQNVETLLEKQDIPDRIRASIEAKKLDLTPEEVEYAAVIMPDAGIMLSAGKMTASQFREVRQRLNDLVNLKEEVGMFSQKTIGTEYIATCVMLAEYGIPLEYANAAVNDYLSKETPEKAAEDRAFLSTDEFQGILKGHLEDKGIVGDISSFYKNPDNRIISTMAGITIGAVGGFLSGGPVGAIVGGTMGVFAGTELPQSLDSLIYAESTLAKLKNAGLGDAASTLKDWNTRADRHTKAYNDAWKSGDFVEAEKELNALHDLEDERATWVEKNWAPLYMAGVYGDEINQIAKTEELIKGRKLYDGTLPDGIKPLDLPRFQPGIDNIVIYPANDKTKKYQVGKNTVGQITMPPGDWIVQVSKPGEVPVEYKYTVSGKGGMSTGELTQERAEVFKQETQQAVATYDVLKTSDVERQAMYDKGVKIAVNTPPGWEVWDIESQKWVDKDYVTVHSEGQKYIRARPKGSNDNPYWTSVRTDNPAGVYQADIDQFSPQVASKDAQGGTSRDQGSVFFDGLIEGSKIYIDGALQNAPERMAGYTGLQGEHTVTIETPGFEAETKTVWLKPDADQHMSLVPTNPAYQPWKTKAELSPYGAGMGAMELKGFKPTDIILVDGERLLPETIDTVLTADPGDYVFEIQREGFETEYKTVRVAVGEKTVASLSPTKTIEQPFKTQFELSQYGEGKGLLKFTGYKPGDQVTLDGKQFTGEGAPEDTKVDQGIHTVVINRTGFEPEYQEIQVKAGEYQSISLVPTKTPYVKYSSGGGGGSYGGGSGGSSVGQKEIAPTVVTIGPNVAGAYLAINKIEKKFKVGEPFNYPFGAWIVKIIKPDGKMFEQAMMFSADGSLYINPADSAFTRTATFPGASGAGVTTTTPTTESDVFYISLTTDPEGAKVLINNSFTGDWTPAKVPLAKGYYTLALYKSGYAKFETALWVDTTMLLGEAAETKARQEGY
jgi:hypothetical protein